MLNRNTYTSLALILALAVSPALAAETEAEPHQPPGAVANANSMPVYMMSEAEGSMPMIQMMMGQDGMRMIAKHIEGRLAFLNTELKITDAQISLWNVFAQAMRDSTTATPAMPHAVTGMKKAVALPTNSLHA